jgi:DGQHR domain-containing protein
MKINAIEFSQGDKKMYISVIKAKDLVAKAKVDIFDPLKGEGYQRELSERRIKDFSVYVREAFKLSPLSILISIRNSENLKYSNGTLEIPDDEQWWIVDGQHRKEGLRDAIQKDKSIENYEVPVVFVPFRDVYEEALQFLIINRTQKPVRTDLAERILKGARERKGLEELEKIRAKGALKRVLEGIEWRPEAIEIAEFLNSDPQSAWFRKIKMPNEKNRDAVVAQKSFTDSLEPILMHSTFGTLPVPKLVNILKNYWDAIKEIYPEAFKNPKKYVLQKTMGVFVFHMLFPVIAEKTRNEKGQYVFTKEKFKKVLSLIEDRYIDSEVWKSSDKKLGIEGGLFASMGTSKKSFRVIFDILARSIENKWEKLMEEKTREPEIIL